MFKVGSKQMKTSSDTEIKVSARHNSAIFNQQLRPVFDLCVRKTRSSIKRLADEPKRTRPEGKKPAMTGAAHTILLCWNTTTSNQTSKYFSEGLSLLNCQATGKPWIKSPPAATPTWPASHQLESVVLAFYLTDVWVVSHVQSGWFIVQVAL